MWSVGWDVWMFGSHAFVCLFLFVCLFVQTVACSAFMAGALTNEVFLHEHDAPVLPERICFLFLRRIFFLFLRSHRLQVQKFR